MIWSLELRGKTVQAVSTCIVWEMKIRPVHPVDSSQWVNEEGRGKREERRAN